MLVFVTDESLLLFLLLFLLFVGVCKHGGKTIAAVSEQLEELSRGMLVFL